MGFKEKQSKKPEAVVLLGKPVRTLEQKTCTSFQNYKVSSETRF